MSSQILTMNTFGDKIRAQREKKGMLLRELAAKIDVDTALLSKVERGERKMKKQKVKVIAKILGLKTNDLITYWMADKIYDLVEDDKNALRAISVAEEQIKYMKS